MIATEACLLSKGRNPELTKEQIEAKLQEYLGAEKIIWLPNGIYQDETNEHVDNVCAFIKPGEVVLAWTDDESDPQYALSAEDLKVLEQETDAKGRKFRVHKILIPKKPVCITEKELAGYVFEEGEDTREAGEIRLCLCRSLETSMMFWQQIYCRSCSRSVRSCQSLQGRSSLAVAISTASHSRYRYADDG